MTEPSTGVTPTEEPEPIKMARRHLAQTAALRESLDEREVEANDLRDSIEQLRRDLDDGQSVPDDEPRRRRPWPWVLAGLLAVLVSLWLLARCDSGVDPVASTSPSPAPARSAQPSVAAATVGAVVVTRPLPWPGGPVLVPPEAATTGPGVDAPGSDVTYALDPDGRTVDVFERMLLAVPAPGVTAVMPPLRSLVGELGASRIGVQDLQVELDSQPVAPTRTSATSWTARLPSGAPVRAATLRYRLSGASMQLEPAVAGRLAALLTPLTGTGSLAAHLPVVVRVEGSGIRSLTCPTAAGGAVLCGMTTDDGASAALPKGSQPIVQLQLDRS